MRFPVLALVAIALAACGGAPTPAPSNAAAPKPAHPAPAASAALGAHMLTRSAVHEVVSEGLGVFLQRVEFADQPVMTAGKFHGFRIATLRDPAFWQNVDLKTGDVVTAVNGFPIEHPEQAETAFESLEVSSELRVAYERDGQQHELVYAIVDEH